MNKGGIICLLFLFFLIKSLNLFEFGGRLKSINCELGMSCKLYQMDPSCTVCLVLTDCVNSELIKQGKEEGGSHLQLV